MNTPYVSPYDLNCAFFQWVKTLVITQKTMLKVGLADIDISSCAEASIKAVLLLEFLCSDNLGAKRNGNRKMVEERLQLKKEVCMTHS